MNSSDRNDVEEHPLAGQPITLEIDGEQQEICLEEGVTQERGEEIIKLMLRLDVPDSPPTVEHPHFELVGDDQAERMQPTAFRPICRVDGCTRTAVYRDMDELYHSDWTAFEIPVGLLGDSTEYVPASCPEHENCGQAVESRFWPLNQIIDSA